MIGSVNVQLWIYEYKADGRLNHIVHNSKEDLAIVHALIHEMANAKVIVLEQCFGIRELEQSDWDKMPAEKRAEFQETYLKTDGTIN